MKLTEKQKRFRDEYIIDCNATQAAIRAGYSIKSAGVIGSENLKKPYVRAAIDKRLEELSLGKQETIKLISDIAKTSLNDYFKIRKVSDKEKIKAPLAEIIAATELEIQNTKKFIKRAKITDSDALKSYELQQEGRKQEIIKMQIELENNPAAYRIVYGEEKIVERAEIDLVKLIKDKEAGRIKSVTPTEFGLKIEMYAADAALRDLGRVHGIFDKDNKQSQAVIKLGKDLEEEIYE